MHEQDCGMCVLHNLQVFLFTENKRSSIWHFCHYWWQRKLSHQWWQGYQIDDLWFSVTLPFPCYAISCNIVGYWAVLYRDLFVLQIFPHIINWHIFSGHLFTSWCFRDILSFETSCADVLVNSFRFTMSKWKASSKDIYVESPFS